MERISEAELVATFPDTVVAMRPDGDSLVVTLRSGVVVVLRREDLLDASVPSGVPN